MRSDKVRSFCFRCMIANLLMVTKTKLRLYNLAVSVNVSASQTSYWIAARVKVARIFHTVQNFTVKSFHCVAYLWEVCRHCVQCFRGCYSPLCRAAVVLSITSQHRAVRVPCHVQQTSILGLIDCKHRSLTEHWTSDRPMQLQQPRCYRLPHQKPVRADSDVWCACLPVCLSGYCWSNFFCVFVSVHKHIYRIHVSPRHRLWLSLASHVSL